MRLTAVAYLHQDVAINCITEQPRSGDMAVRLRDLCGCRLEQDLPAEANGAMREIALIRARLRRDPVNERAALRIQVVPRLLQVD
jgi:hypothetical protein